jgi:hypothetical protein
MREFQAALEAMLQLQETMVRAFVPWLQTLNLSPASPQAAAGR